MRLAATSMCCAPARRCACPRPPTSTRWRRPSRMPRFGGRRTSGRTARRKAASCGCCRRPRPRSRARRLRHPRRRLHDRPTRDLRRRRCCGSCRCGRRRGQSAAARAPQCRAAKLAAGRRGSRGARGRAARRSRVGGPRRRARIRATVRGRNRARCSARRRGCARSGAGARCCDACGDRAVARIAGHRLAPVAVAVDRSRRRRLAADGAVVRSPSPPRGRGCDGSLGSARIGDGRRC